MKIFLFVIIPFFICISGEPKVHTDLGEIIGTEWPINNGSSSLYMFLGIPYGKPPKGSLRFRDPQPYTKPFKTPYKAVTTYRCLQYLTGRKVVIGVEDCLYLNIFTTSLSSDSNYDVLVFIHGGGFVYGAGHTYAPHYLYEADTKLVYVSINYRLGPFGFMSTEDCEVPGNMGLKDQVLALEWVQKNIKPFGGDPNKVTIAGMSAGGVSVHFHYLSPMSKHLFTHGISMSGTALSSLAHTKNARKNSEALATLVDCPTDNTTSMINCLREKEGQIIMESLYNKLLPWERYNSFTHFGPVIENFCSKHKPFLHQHPYHLIRRNKIKHAPWLASATTGEGLKPGATFVGDNDRLKELNDHWDSIAPHLLVYTESASEETQIKVSQQIRAAYLGDQPITPATRNNLVKLIGDRLYMNSIESAVRLHAHASKSPVYYYMFDYRGVYSMTQIYSNSNMDLGVSHVDDLIYILKMEKMDPTVQDKPMIAQMTTMWMTFIQKNIPQTSLVPKWPEIATNIVVKGNLEYIMINGPRNMSVVLSPDMSRREFWDSLPLDELHISGNRNVPWHIFKQQDWIGQLNMTWIYLMQLFWDNICIVLNMYCKK